MRGSATEALDADKVCCWPTPGAISVGNANWNASISRCLVGLRVKTAFPMKLLTVSMAPSCKSPVPLIWGPGCRNIPTVSYISRVWGTLNVTGSPSKVISPLVPKNPFAGSSSWHPLQVAPPSEALLKYRSLPACSSAVRDPSIAAIGLGGSVNDIAKSLNCCISDASMWWCFPSSPSKASMKLLKANCSEQSAPVGSLQGSCPKKPDTLSPRQCCEPWVDIPLSVCVRIGPFIG